MRHIKIHLCQVLIKFVSDCSWTLTSSTVPTCYITHEPPPASIIPVPYWTIGRISSQFQFNPVCVELHVEVDASNAKKSTSSCTGRHVVNSSIVVVLYISKDSVETSYSCSRTGWPFSHNSYSFPSKQTVSVVYPLLFSISIVGHLSLALCRESILLYIKRIWCTGWKVKVRVVRKQSNNTSFHDNWRFSRWCHFINDEEFFIKNDCKRILALIHQVVS